MNVFRLEVLHVDVGQIGVDLFGQFHVTGIGANEEARLGDRFLSDVVAAAAALLTCGAVRLTEILVVFAPVVLARLRHGLQAAARLGVLHTGGHQRRLFVDLIRIGIRRRHRIQKVRHGGGGCDSLRRFSRSWSRQTDNAFNGRSRSTTGRRKHVAHSETPAERHHSGPFRLRNESTRRHWLLVGYTRASSLVLLIKSSVLSKNTP